MTLLWVKDDGGGWGFWADCCKPELTAVDCLASPLRGSRQILQLTQDCVRWCALVLHPSDEDLSLGTPAFTPATKTCRWGPRPSPQRRRPVAGDPGLHPSDEDLSLGTPALG